MTEQHVKLGLQREPMMQRNAGGIDAMTLSEIVAISQEAARLRASGHDVLAFRTGVPRLSDAYACADFDEGCARLNRAVQGLSLNQRTAL
ncbi:hypothetical protein FGG78_14750 [Thioclava sp. BHET1]|nr:hypothetical protein FGG78_14750 [Thioclava sp. BHET1]